VQGKAEYIVSGDDHLLGLKTFRNIPIITAREFIERL
jgi:predicted nucleic acid-binding protein